VFLCCEGVPATPVNFCNSMPRANGCRKHPAAALLQKSLADVLKLQCSVEENRRPERVMENSAGKQKQ